LLADFADPDTAVQLAAVKRAASYDELPDVVMTAAFRLHQATTDQSLREAIEAAGQQLGARQSGFDPEQVARVKELSQLQVTQESPLRPDSGGHMRLSIPVAANGAAFVVIENSDQSP
jgi:hypothetical protein